MSWTRRPMRFFQHLLREIDAIDLDPADLVRESQLLGADGTIAMAGGFSAWYPTRLAAQPTNPHLRGDVLGELVQAAHDADMRVLARMDISKGQPAALEANPDWFVRKPDGAPSLVWDMPQICATGAFWSEHAFAILDEILARTPVDGFFFNYFHVPRCHCARCQKIVQAATGAAVPAPGTRTPAYEAWRQDTLAAYCRQLRDFIHARAPQAVLAPYHHLRNGWNIRAMAAASDLISAQISNPVLPNPIDPQPMWNHWAAEEALLGFALKPTPPLLISTGSAFFASRQTAMPAARMVHNLLQAMAHGAGVCPAINGRLAQDDPRSIPALVELGRYQTIAARWYEGLSSVARVAIIRSDASIAWGADAGRAAGDPAGWGHIAEFRGVYEMLTDLRYPCAVLPDGGLGEVELNGFDVIIQPSTTYLSDADTATLAHYVEAGGTLIVTGAQRGASRSIMGAYFEIADPVLRQRLGGAPHIGADGAFWELEPRGVCDLRLIGPFSNNAPEYTVVKGPGAAPGLLTGSLGRGTIHTLPWHIGALYHRTSLPDYRVVLAHLLEPWVGASPISTDAPTAVECILLRHPEGHVLHLLNGAASPGERLIEITPLAGFTVRVRVPAVQAVDCRTGQAIPSWREGVEIVFAIDRLDAFAAIALLDQNERMSP